MQSGRLRSFGLMALVAKRRIWLRSAALLASAAIVTGSVSVVRVSPLTTHVLRAPLNSTATSAPTPLPGIASLPALLWSNAEPQRWAIMGGSLLQAGLSGFSVPSLTRAVAADSHDHTLRAALGEAVVLAHGGAVTNEAKLEFEAVLAADPNDLVARFYMAHWLLQNGKPKLALVKWVGLMRTVGNDPLWYDRLWDVMPRAAEQVGVSPLALQALCVAGM
jgi:cytochrome c-type biogenesis protein CcmH/NrfG